MSTTSGIHQLVVQSGLNVAAQICFLVCGIVLARKFGGAGFWGFSACMAFGIVIGVFRFLVHISRLQDVYGDPGIFDEDGFARRIPWLATAFGVLGTLAFCAAAVCFALGTARILSWKQQFDLWKQGER